MFDEVEVMDYEEDDFEVEPDYNYGSEEYNYHDDRYDGNSIPSWSVFA